MIETYKILNNKYDNDVSKFLCLHQDISDNPERVRGHSKKLYKRKFKKNIRKHSFGMRIVNVWNSLPESIVSSPSLNIFEHRLDNYWENQDIRFDFKKGINTHHSNNTPYGAGSNEETAETLRNFNNDLLI